MAYATQTQIEAILGRSLTANELINLTGLQLTIDNWINEQTGISFGVGSSSRFYDGGIEVLSIDPVRDITSVEAVDSTGVVAFTYTDGQDYVAGPLNSTVKTYLAKRRYISDSWDDDNLGGLWPRGLKSIKITGTFSYADTVPSDISYLSAYLSAKMLETTGSSLTGAIKSESIEGYSRTYEDVTSGVSSMIEGDMTVSMILGTYTSQEILF